MSARGAAFSASVAAAALLVVAPVEAARDGHPPCPPRGQAVIRSDGALRIYRPKIAPGALSGVPVLACLRGTATRMTLVSAGAPIHHAAPARSGSLELIATSAPVVAYVVNRLTGVDTSASQLLVADVSRRAVLREAPAGYGVDAGLVFSERVSDLAVTAHGQVAWIEQRSGGAVRSPGATVIAAARTGPAVIMDEGPGVAPQSLYLSGGTVHWVDGDSTRSAPLP